MMRPTLIMPETFDDCLTYAKQLRKLYEEYLKVLRTCGILIGAFLSIYFLVGAYNCNKERNRKE